jgi:hypothetical protein
VIFFEEGLNTIFSAKEKTKAHISPINIK